MRTPIRHWTEAEDQWLRLNHATQTYKQAAQHLQCNTNQIMGRVSHLGLSKLRDYAALKSGLARMKSPEIVYLLGYLWADGYLRKSRPYQVSLTINVDDANSIRDIVQSTGEWCETLNRANDCGGRKNAALTKFYATSKELCVWFERMGFHGKSINGPVQLLASIPTDLHHYFWRGYFDGDGCICSTSSGRAMCISFTAAAQQDWGELAQQLTAIGVHFSVSVNRARRGSNSTLRIWRKADVFKTMAYLWNGHKFGLRRKLAVYQERAHHFGLPPISEENGDTDFVALAQAIPKRVDSKRGE